MILRKVQWILICKLLYTVLVVDCQNERAYDTNDWVPITPSPNANREEAPKNAVGRVLNLDAPSQKLFPEDEYRKRRPRPHHARENVRQKDKSVDRYRFEVPPKQNAPRIKQFNNEEVKLSYEQPPPLHQGGFIEKPILTRQQAPAVDALNLYEQYNLPFNSSFYQSLNPSSINQELQNEFQNTNVAPSNTPSSNVKDENQSVQLLYVPLENLKPNQPSTQITQDSQNIYQQISPPGQSNQIFSQNNQHLIDDIEQDLIQQTVQAHRLQQQIHLGRPVVLQTTTTTTATPKTTKRKPHQPPLAVYLEASSGADTDDVLDVLKDAKTITVQDSVLPNSPQVFIGPSTLNLPLGYNRFPLPYINKLEGNKIERKIENLPFFVAPLSYKAPPGYSKILLPSPHVGSVLVSNKEDSHKRAAPRPTSIYQNHINGYESTKPYSTPDVSNANAQTFVPNQQTYYSTSSFLNPTGDAQKPQYLQFTVNGNVNKYALPPQQQLPQLNVNNIPSRSQPQTSNIPVETPKTPEAIVPYNQLSGNENPRTTPQQITPNTNNNPYSSSISTSNEDQNKYNFNQNQNIKIPSGSTTSLSNNNQDIINSYQIPVKSSAGISQYNQQVDGKKEYSLPQTFSNENLNPYQVPSRSPQRNTANPPKTTTSYQDVPSAFLSSAFGNDHGINITPKTTTTPKPSIEQYQPYSFSSGQKKANPLDLAINQYELHQINSQLVQDNTEKDSKDPYDFSSPFRYNSKPEVSDYGSQFQVQKSKVKGKYDYSSVFDVDVEKPKYEYNSEYERYSSTPASILRDTYEEITTTPRAPPKTRRRSRPTVRTTTTTAHPHGKESYTVLEEYSANPATIPNRETALNTEAPKEVKYEPEYKFPTQPEAPDVPANVYRIKTTTPKYDHVKVEPVTNHYDIKTVIQDVPQNPYNLNLNQNTQIYTNPSSQHLYQNQNKQGLQTNFEKPEDVSHTYSQRPSDEVSYTPQYNENPVIEPIVQNRGQKHQVENTYSFNKQPDLPDYTNNLQDQSVRTLLMPNLLIPTSEPLQPNTNYDTPIEQYSVDPTTTTTTTTTSTTTTTEKPSTTRGRGRQRGGNRFSTVSATTTGSVPRRTVNRRRPVHSSRTTTTENSNQQYASREDFQRVTPRQRFRTRGRPSQTTATERVSSTENEVRSYKEQTTEIPLEIQTNPTGPQSYMQFEHTVKDQKLVIQSEDVPVTDYPQYYNHQEPVTATESPRLILQYDNTGTTQNPIMDIQITHPVPKIKKLSTVKTNEESQIHLQAGGVLHNNHNNDNDGNSRQTSRVRGRARSRTRVATTTSERPVSRTTARPVIRIAPKRTTTAGTTTTTEIPTAKSAAEEEFFGFIRQPNFNQIYNIQVPSATQQPLVYQNSPNQGGNTDVRVSTYQVFGSPNNNQNIQNVQSYQIPQNSQDDVRLDLNGIPSDATTVQFVGEIRPKYRPTTDNEDIIIATDHTEPIEIEPETPRSRVRGRVRIPQRKSNVRHSDSEVSTSRTQQATRRSNVVRSRGRGNVHYRLPENVRPKEDKEADVEGGNYPASFFQNRQTATTSAPSFQISIDQEEDQLTNPSLYQPKVLPRPEKWTEATDNTANEEYAPANELERDISIEIETVVPNESHITEQPREETIATEKEKESEKDEFTNQPVALPVAISDESTTPSSDEAYIEHTKAMEELFEEINKTEKPHKGKGTRRGAWKLVRTRPVDPYEVAESQNYYSVLNSFGDIGKVKDKANWYNNEKENGGSVEDVRRDEAYNNYNPVLEQNSETYDYESQKIQSTERPEYTETKYYEVHDLNAETESPTVEFHTTINTTDSYTHIPTTTPKGSILDTIYEMFSISDKSQDVTEPPTTVSPVSDPETSETMTPTTTVVSPTFPEEITEVPTTTVRQEMSNNSTDVDTTEKIEATSQKTQITRTYEVEPWEMRAVRTSTSTEVSHETEICYRGRCVKSTDRSV